MSENVDILVLGATGFTGRLVTRYLVAHPARNSFTFGIAARSKSKLDALAAELGIDDNMPHIYVDVTDDAQVEAAVLRAKIVINLVGPYSRWGTPVVQACVKHGRHHVDLSGETHWIKKIIDEFDYYATKTGSIIIPSCGFDSMPSDISAYIANKTVKEILGPDASIEQSLTGFKLKGSTPSGGTLATATYNFGELSLSQIHAVTSRRVLSPVQGSSPPPRLFYELKPHSPPITGAFFIMSNSNTAIVDRTWGLHEVQVRQRDNPPEHLKRLAYGPKFVYDEFLITNSMFYSLLLGIASALIAFCLFMPPTRALIKRFGLQSGEGPSEETMRNGYLEAINITSTVATPETPKIYVKSVIRGKGDPGYSLTAVMIAEAALCILLSHDQLPELGQRGGVLTPMSGLGDVLIERLKGSGKFEFESKMHE